MEENKTFYEKVYMLLPLFENEENEQERIDECRELLKSARAELVGVTVQKIRKITPSTFMGEGKLTEAKDSVVRSGADMIIFDGALSPSQTMNISEIFGGIKVIDRTALILDIFALSAFTKEGKLQVELAQLEYIYPRLKGKGADLSRLGGGIGTRGPGETQLETDRRHIRQRIISIKSALSEIETRRKLATKRRNKNNAITVAITGYTNAGKSTLFNLLSGSDILAENRLFATLDATARKVKIGEFYVIMIDTVGFIRNIPTEIVEAFKSTLESAIYADVILNVADASGNYEECFEVTEKTLSDLHCTSPIIKVLNKCDKISDFSAIKANAVKVSAKTGSGIDELKEKIADEIKKEYSFLELKLPYDKINKFYTVKDFAENYEISYKPEYIEITVVTKSAFKSRFTSL